MDVPDNATSSFVMTVPPGQTVKTTLPEGVEACITQICVGPCDDLPTTGNSAVYVKVNSQSEISIASFILGRIESLETVLYFSKHESLEFHSAGQAVPIQILGFLVGAFSLQTETA